MKSESWAMRAASVTGSVICIGVAHADVLTDGAGVDGRALQDAADAAAQGVLAESGGVAPVKEDAPLRRRAGKPSSRCISVLLPLPGAADDGDALPRQNVQGDVADGVRGAAVGEADILQLDLAVQLSRFAGHGLPMPSAPST